MTGRPCGTVSRYASRKDSTSSCCKRGGGCDFAGAEASALDQPATGADGDAGIGYAFVEFATVEGASKAKKALNGRRFGENLVEAEYFSESKYHSRDFAKPLPNTEEPHKEVGHELVLFGAGGTPGALDEAPVMAD